MENTEQNAGGLEVQPQAMVAVPQEQIYDLMTFEKDGKGYLIADYAPVSFKDFEIVLVVGLHPKKNDRATFHQGETAYIAKIAEVYPYEDSDKEALKAFGIVPEKIKVAPEKAYILELTDLEKVIEEPILLPSPGFYAGGQTVPVWKYTKNISLTVQDAAPK